MTAWVNGHDPRPRRDSAAITDSTLVTPGTHWDPTAFRAAVHDLAGTDGTLPALAELAGRQLPHHHAALLQRQLGVPHLDKLLSASPHAAG
ncbi:hypothetical protein [Amycolatopsis sp. YIM 10]|uniref:hypothetical protein n=1 Tax=Amycolatopsis sp. YIM 10 TaxID=2653857 RepID=UPI00129020E0|nr:hypothetical protein [Amycolatopsis sp. YIM 10]